MSSLNDNSLNIICSLYLRIFSFKRNKSASNIFWIKFIVKRFFLVNASELSVRCKIIFQMFSKLNFNECFSESDISSVFSTVDFTINIYESIIAHRSRYFWWLFENKERFRWKILRFRFNNFRSLSVSKFVSNCFCKLIKLLTKITFCNFTKVVEKSITWNKRKKALTYFNDSIASNWKATIIFRSEYRSRSISACFMTWRNIK